MSQQENAKSHNGDPSLSSNATGILLDSTREGHNFPCKPHKSCEGNIRKLILQKEISEQV